MKKIILILMLITSGAYAWKKPSNYQEPPISDNANKWLNGYTGAYSTKINSEANTGYPSLYDKLGPNSEKKPVQRGTTGEQGAILLFAARIIYEHGAEICPVQIQAANQSSEMIWLDYHWESGWNCVRLCEPGYSGDDCETPDEQVQCDDTKVLTNLPSLISDGEYKSRKTKEMEVLDFQNGYDEDSSAIILGVIKRLEHGALVAPTKITSGHQVGGKLYTYIESVYSNNKKTLLCQDGYVGNSDNTDCIKNAECEISASTSIMCYGYDKNNYNEDVHVLKTKKNSIPIGYGLSLKMGSSNCTYFECKDGYALESKDNNYQCIECEITKKQGKNSEGLCEKCDTGEFFNTTDKKCKTAKSISKEKMRECYMKRTREDFKNCVIGD